MTLPRRLANGQFLCREDSAWVDRMIDFYRSYAYTQRWYSPGDENQRRLAIGLVEEAGEGHLGATYRLRRGA